MSAYAGFDSANYPGDAWMAWLKQNTNLVWCGFYLAPAPSHGNTSWMTRRAALTAAGWNLAPIYVGEQVIPPGSENPSAAKGTADGQNAVSLMTTEGFSQGSCVFLDLEDGSLPAELSAYTAAWLDAVGRGGFTGGVYCSHVIAAQVNTLKPALPLWVFRVQTTAVHASGGPPFSAPDPSDCGYGGARIWQFEQNALLTAPGMPGPIQVDFSSSATSDPGAAPIALALAEAGR
jgi:hypothetical protein